MYIKKLVLIILLILQASSINQEQFNTLETLVNTYGKEKKTIKNETLAIFVVRQQFCVACVKKLYEFIFQTKSDKIYFIINEELINEEDNVNQNKNVIVVPSSVILRRDIGISSVGVLEVSNSKIIQRETIDINNLNKVVNRIEKKYQ